MIARWTLALGIAAALGCEAEIPDATYVCATGDECPPGQLCDVSRGLCVRQLPCTSPLTCELLRADCGAPEDGCGGTLDCGECEGVDSCGGGGVEFVCGCTRETCESAGASCGTIDDGCGGTRDCGGCAPPDQCVEGSCGCADPSACDGRSCGDVVDACGEIVSCGSCPVDQSCAMGTCSDGECVPAPLPCAAAGLECGSVEDGCGGTVSCGTCASPDTCNGGGTPGQCGCTPTATCDSAGAECGSVSDGCRGTITCPSTCSEFEVCAGTTCECRPDSYEPNDTASQASDQGALAGRAALDGPTIDDGADDHFRWSYAGVSDGNGSYIEVELRGIPVGSDYDLRVFVECIGGDSDGGVACNQGVAAESPTGKRGCESTRPGTNVETVSFTDRCGVGVHQLEVHVRVEAWSGACGPYELEVVGPS